MWNIRHDKLENYSYLHCQTTAVHESGISSLRIYNFNDAQLQFEITSAHPEFLADFNRRLEQLEDSVKNNIVWNNTNNTISIRISIESDLKALITILRFFDDRIRNFADIRAALPLIVAANKILLIQTHKEQMHTVVKTIESQAENTMRGIFCATARNSELALRARYNFEAPMYSWFFNTATPPPDDEDDDLFQGSDDEMDADDDTEPVAFSFLVNAVNHGQAFPPPPPPPPQIHVEQLDEFQHTNDYTDEENALIENLISVLETKQTNLINSGYLIVNEHSQRVVLSQHSKNILCAARTNASATYVNSATMALEVKTALRALSPGGSYSHNHAMYRTGITGYGLRNIVALMWHCCLEAKKQNSFMLGVTPLDGLKAIIRGITNGARDGNRQLHEYDDLHETDQPACDAGKFNSLIAAFIGIFPEVKIVFDLTEGLVDELKRFIMTELTATTNDYRQARIYRDLWAGYNVCPKTADYEQFVARVIAKVPEAINKFLNDVSPYDPILKEQIKQDISQEIRKVEEVNLGLKFIEIVDPSISDLNSAWKKAYPFDPAPDNYETARATGMSLMYAQSNNRSTSSSSASTKAKKRSRKGPEL